MTLLLLILTAIHQPPSPLGCGNVWPLMYLGPQVVHHVTSDAMVFGIPASGKTGPDREVFGRKNWLYTVDCRAMLHQILISDNFGQ